MISLPLARSSRPRPSTGLGQRLRRWLRNRSDRRQLMALSDAMLRDIGLSRADVLREYQRPFWEEVDYPGLEVERRRSAGRREP